MSRSFLALGAVVRRALALSDLANRSTADSTRLARTLVHVELLPEVAGAAVDSDIVAESGPTRLDSQRQNRTDGSHELGNFLALEAAGLPARPHARTKQCFAGVDIADADHQRAVHDQ